MRFCLLSKKEVRRLQFGIRPNCRNHDHLTERAVQHEAHRLAAIAEAKRLETALNADQGHLASRHRQRARESGVVGSWTAVEWNALCEKFDFLCLRCHQKLPLTPDHVIPISHGGPNVISNIQPLCQRCNSIKGTRHTDYRIYELESLPVVSDGSQEVGESRDSTILHPSPPPVTP